MSRRTRWTQEELQKLQEIYEQERAEGTKRLWVRVTDRINKEVRTAKRQAIQYKWKNFCRDPPNSIKLCQNQRLIQLLLALVPEKGYKELSNNEHFRGISQSTLKNIFYSNIRSISKFLHSHLHVNESTQQITNMLKNRKFLLCLQNEKINFLEFRNKVNSLKKKLIPNKKPIKDMNDINLAVLKSDVLNFYDRIRQIFLSSETDTNKLSQTTINPKQFMGIVSSTSFKQVKPQYGPSNYPMSMQYLENSFIVQKKQLEDDQKQGSFISVGDWQSRVYPIKFNEAICSTDWLCNDF